MIMRLIDYNVLPNLQYLAPNEYPECATFPLGPILERKRQNSSPKSQNLQLGVAAH